MTLHMRDMENQEIGRARQLVSSLIQLRVDDKLKEEATNLYEKLGLDLPTAIRMVLTRSVQEEG